MKLKVNNLLIDINKDKEIVYIVCEKFKIKKEDLNEVIITKKSVDARRKENIKIIYSLILDVADYTTKRLIQYKEISMFEEEIVELEYPIYINEHRPVIIGFGPAGIFSALYLARCKAKPIIIERGSDMDNRVKDVKDFLENKKLNINSNVVFGEGGAGTFSDGKLTTNVKDKLNKFILEEFVKHGAPKEILYEHMPHIGTDILEIVIKNIRKEIIELGGEVYFNSTFYKYEKTNSALNVYIKQKDKDLVLTTNKLFLGLGHSAFDTISYLKDSGLCMQPKAFSMGVRIEHKREYINKIQYGDYHRLLKSATYKLAVNLGDRSLYTFCMCPGGMVMPSSNDENSIVTNGMSKYKRDDYNSNSALLVNVTPEDYYVDDVLDGFKYQKRYEKLAFDIAEDYRAPANLVKEFLQGRVAKSIRSVKPSYPHGVVLCDLRDCLPNFVYKTIKEGLKKIEKSMPGFCYDDAILTGVETRSSCPVRILRDENRLSNVNGIYPMGEGAGYAGGIMSAALDGLKTAISVAKENGKC